MKQNIKNTLTKIKKQNELINTENTLYLKTRKEQKGITLIALVITIIVLLILAGVAIATLLGDNGIITKASKAKIETQISSEDEQIKLAVEAEKTNQLGGDITAEGLQSELDKLKANATVITEGSGFRIIFNDSKREYVIDKDGNVLEVYDPQDKNIPETEEVGKWTKLNKVSKTGGFNTSKGVNAPKLGSELTAVTLTSDKTSYTEDGTWYDYKEQEGSTDGKKSKWANAVTTDSKGDITGYYVWIPRFAYKITSGYHTSNTGTIEIKFLKDATNEFADGTSETVETDPSKITYKNGNDGEQEQWLVHPAFLSDASIGGGFGSKSGNSDGITGIWVAKFEISAYIDSNETSTRMVSTQTAKEQIHLKVLPGVESSSVGNIGTMYTLAYNMNRKSESHMLKNSEWGAVAYLAHSAYGRNGTKVTINSQKYSSKDSSSGGTDFFTGGSDTEDGYLNNGDQSTTGNEYGVYDLSGGKYEYVASYINNGSSNLESYGKDMLGSDARTSTKYKTVYKHNPSDTGSDWDSRIQSKNYELSKEIKGDAVYEISPSARNTTTWTGNLSNFPCANGPFFNRGAGTAKRETDGLFSFCPDDGSLGDASSFRSCLVIG